MMGDGDIDIYAGLSPMKSKQGNLMGEQASDNLDIYAGLSPEKPRRAGICNGNAEAILKMPPPPSPQDESSNMSTFDLYSDLIDEESRPKETVAKLQETNNENEGKISDLVSKIENLQKENGSLQTQNSTLKQNISTLLKTAKLEIKRKDWQLMQLKLRSNNAVHRSSFNSSMLQPDVDDSPRETPCALDLSSRVSSNLIPLGKQRQFGPSLQKDARKQPVPYGRGISPDRVKEIKEQSFKTPPCKRIPRGPHTPPGEPPPSPEPSRSKVRERPHLASQSLSTEFEKLKPHESTNHDRLPKEARHLSRDHKKLNHDRQVKSSDHPHSKPNHEPEHAKGAKQERHNPESLRLNDRKRKRSEENVKESSSRYSRRRESRESEKSREPKESQKSRDERHSREQSVDRLRDNSRRRRARSVQKAKESFYKSNMSPPSDTRDKYNRMQRSGSVSRRVTEKYDDKMSKGRERLKQSEPKRNSDRQSSNNHAMRTRNDDRFRRPEDKATYKDTRSSKSNVDKNKPDVQNTAADKKKKIRNDRSEEPSQGAGERTEREKSKSVDLEIELDLEEGELYSDEEPSMPLKKTRRTDKEQERMQNTKKPRNGTETKNIESAKLSKVDNVPLVDSQKQSRARIDGKRSTDSITPKAVNEISSEAVLQKDNNDGQVSTHTEAFIEAKNCNKSQNANISKDDPEVLAYKVTTCQAVATLSVLSPVSETLKAKDNQCTDDLIGGDKHVSETSNDQETTNDIASSSVNNRPVSQIMKAKDADKLKGSDIHVSQTPTDLKTIQDVASQSIKDSTVSETSKDKGNHQDDDALAVSDRLVSETSKDLGSFQGVVVSPRSDKTVSGTSKKKENTQDDDSTAVCERPVPEISEKQVHFQSLETPRVVDKPTGKTLKDQETLKAAENLSIVPGPVSEILGDQEVTKMEETSLTSLSVCNRHISETSKRCQSMRSMDSSSDAAGHVSTSETLTEQGITETIHPTSIVVSGIPESYENKSVQNADVVSSVASTNEVNESYEQTPEVQCEIVCETFNEQEDDEPMDVDVNHEEHNVQLTGTLSVPTERGEESIVVTATANEISSFETNLDKNVPGSAGAENLTEESKVTNMQTNSGSSLSEKSSSDDVQSMSFQKDMCANKEDITLRTEQDNQSVTHKACALEDEQTCSAKTLRKDDSIKPSLPKVQSSVTLDTSVPHDSFATHDSTATHDSSVTHSASVTQNVPKLTDTPCEGDIIKGSPTEPHLFSPEVEKSNSPPLRYEFSPHFIQTIDAPMMQRSVSISGEHSESSCGSVQSGSSNSTNAELGADDASNSGHKDPLENVRKHLFAAPDNDDSLTRASFGNQDGGQITATDVESQAAKFVSYDQQISILAQEENPTDSHTFRGITKHVTQDSAESHTDTCKESIENSGLSAKIELVAQIAKIIPSNTDSSTSFEMIAANTNSSTECSTGFMAHDKPEDSNSSIANKLSNQKILDLNLQTDKERNGRKCEETAADQLTCIASVPKQNTDDSMESCKEIADGLDSQMQVDSPLSLPSQEKFESGNSSDSIQEMGSSRSAGPEAEASRDGSNNTDGSLVSMEELKRLEAEAEKALDIIFTRRIPGRIHKMKKGMVHKNNTTKERKGKRKAQKSPGSVVEVSSSSIKESLQVKTNDNHMESTSNSEARKQIVEKSGIQNLSNGPAAKEKVKVQIMPGHYGTKDHSIHIEDVVELHPDDTSLLDDMFLEDEPSAVDMQKSNGERSKFKRSNTEVVKVAASQSAIMSDTAHVSKTKRTPCKSDKLQSGRSGQTSMPKEGSLTGNERSSARERLNVKVKRSNVNAQSSNVNVQRSNERMSKDTKVTHQDKKHASNSTSREENRTKHSAGNHKRNLHISDDKDGGKRQKRGQTRLDSRDDEYSRTNHNSHSKESYSTKRDDRGEQRSFRRHDSPVHDRRSSDRVRQSTRDRSRTPTSSDIKAILRSVSVKIATEIDHLTSRSKGSSRQSDELKNQLQRSERIKPAPWGCKDLREGSSSDMNSHGKSADDSSQKNSKATNHDESLSEGEIVSDSESEEAPKQIEKRYVSEKSSRQRTSATSRIQERRNSFRQSPRLKSTRLTRTRDGRVRTGRRK